MARERLSYLPIAVILGFPHLLGVLYLRRRRAVAPPEDARKGRGKGEVPFRGRKSVPDTHSPPAGSAGFPRGTLHGQKIQCNHPPVAVRPVKLLTTF